MTSQSSEPDEQMECLEASMTATEFFKSLEACDSKRVDDFWALLDDTVLEILNLNGRYKGNRDTC